MTRARLFCLLPLLLLLPGCATPEPIDGCLLAAANRREVIERARPFLHPAIPARILLFRSADNRAGHAALVYRLPEGFICYDDTSGSRPLRCPWPDARTFPPALTVARVAFPGWPVGQAWWLESATAR